MPDIPPEAVRLALVARAHALIDRPTPTALSDERLTEMMLEAAAPVLAEHVAAKILAHMEAHTPADEFSLTRQRYRMHFGTAARVAARAFLTEDDEKRLAAQALARGDYVHCTALEDPE